MFMICCRNMNLNCGLTSGMDWARLSSFMASISVLRSWAGRARNSSEPYQCSLSGLALDETLAPCRSRVEEINILFWMIWFKLIQCWHQFLSHICTLDYFFFDESILDLKLWCGSLRACVHTAFFSGRKAAAGPSILFLWQHIKTLTQKNDCDDTRAFQKRGEKSFLT